MSVLLLILKRRYNFEFKILIIGSYINLKKGISKGTHLVQREKYSSGNFSIETCDEVACWRLWPVLQFTFSFYIASVWPLQGVFHSAHYINSQFSRIFLQRNFLLHVQSTEYFNSEFMVRYLGSGLVLLICLVL